MNKKQKYLIFFLGSIIGCLMVSKIFTNKLKSRGNVVVEQKINPWRGKIMTQEETPLTNNETQSVRILNDPRHGLIRIEEIIKNYRDSGKNIIQKRTVIAADRLNILTKPNLTQANLSAILSKSRAQISKTKSRSGVYQIQFEASTPNQVMEVKSELIKNRLIENVQFVYFEEENLSDL